MKNTNFAKVMGSVEIEKPFTDEDDNKDILVSFIGELAGEDKKPNNNGEYTITRKIKVKFFTDIKVGEEKIEIKPQKGSWAQNTRNEIISFWKNEIRDKSEKTHQDIYGDFCKWVDNKIGEFYQEEIKKYD